MVQVQMSVSTVQTARLKEHTWNAKIWLAQRLMVKVKMIALRLEIVGILHAILVPEYVAGQRDRVLPSFLVGR